MITISLILIIGSSVTYFWGVYKQKLNLIFVSMGILIVSLVALMGFLSYREIIKELETTISENQLIIDRLTVVKYTLKEGIKTNTRRLGVTNE